MKIVLIAIGVAFVLAIAVAVIRRLTAASIETKDVDVLSFKDVVSFFKRPGVMEMLKATPDRIAVAIKEKQQGPRTLVSLCAFNQRTDKVELPFGRFNAAALDAELLSAFNGKDMIVLK